ncbi:hypothetical protein RR48_03871 [Papilio machaon]|uniref:Uncharacterized protein n=1 Tax=Papilio machaon TaxID=76193 RepID=A0A0N1IPX5_PAPMA|nr:hypothetical protein RR48_03871 [Papilio machaon]
MAIRRDCYSAVIKQAIYELTVDEYQLGGITRCENLRKKYPPSRFENGGSSALCARDDLDYVILRIVCIKKFDRENQKWRVCFYKKKIIRECNCVPEYAEDRIKDAEKLSTDDQLCAAFASVSLDQHSQNRLVEFQKCFADFMLNEGFDESDFNLTDLTPGSACCKQLGLKSIEYAHDQPQGSRNQ